MPRRGRPAAQAEPAQASPQRFAEAGLAADSQCLGEFYELGRRERLGAGSSRTTEGVQGLGGSLAGGDAGELERVRERLSPVGERRLDHALEIAPGDGFRLWDASEGDERRVDVRLRAEDGTRHRVKARPLRRELDEHRDGSVRLRTWLGEEAVCDLALHHHAPVPHGRKPVETLDDKRRGHAVRKVGDQLRRLQAPEVDGERVTELELDIRWKLRQARSERAIDLHGMHAGDAIGQVAREDSDAGPDLEDDVGRVELRQAADDAKDVLVDEEVLPELAPRAHGNLRWQAQRDYRALDGPTQTPFSLIRELACLLGDAHVRFWLRGGWALDFHAGLFTRPHKDVDLVTWTRHRARLRTLLESNGYVTVRFDEPQVFFEKRGQEVNFAMIQRGSGGAIVTPEFEDWPWPEGAFSGPPTTLHGVRCRVLTLEALLEEKEGYEEARGVPLRPKDEISLRLLRELVGERERRRRIRVDARG
jgi:Aminoglycoside-2''-adenylyltransferase